MRRVTVLGVKTKLYNSVILFLFFSHCFCSFCCFGEHFINFVILFCFLFSHVLGENNMFLWEKGY